MFLLVHYGPCCGLKYALMCFFLWPVKGDIGETDSNKFSSESETTTPKTPHSARFEDTKFFGSNFNLDALKDPDFVNKMSECMSFCNFI